jgi:hypothetical protein
MEARVPYEYDTEFDSDSDSDSDHASDSDSDEASEEVELDSTDFYKQLSHLYVDPFDSIMANGSTFIDIEGEGILSALNFECTDKCQNSDCLVEHDSIRDRSIKPPKTNISASVNIIECPVINDLQVVSDNDETAMISLPFESSLPECNSLSATITLNNALGIRNAELKDTLQDLSYKSNIIQSGILTPSEFADAQQLDPAISLIRESFDPKRHKSLQIKDNILCKKNKTGLVPYLPKSLETFLFNCMHFHISSGHRSAETIISAIKDQFFVPDLPRKVKSFCRNCYICSISKSQRMQSAMQGVTKQATYPKQIMSFDIFGGLTDDPDGYTCVYSFMDNFSLFVINIKARSKSMKEILGAFLEVFAIWSQIPLVVCSDNETGLMTTESSDFFASFGILHNPGPAYAHWRLLSESSSIRKSKEFMRSVLFSDPTQSWATALDLGTLALNQTKTIHGFSPVQMFYGNFKPTIPIISQTVQCTTADEYDTLVKERYNEIVKAVNDSRTAANAKRTELINKHRKAKTFDVNQLVWLKALAITPHKAVKVQNKGPFKILEKVNECTYKLSTLSDPDKCDRISHASHMETYKNSVDLTTINFPKINLNPKAAKASKAATPAAMPTMATRAHATKKNK